LENQVELLVNLQVVDQQLRERTATIEMLRRGLARAEVPEGQGKAGACRPSAPS
jgi:hypothetical protein